MSTNRFQIPEGMQDILLGECVRKRCLEQQLRTLFALSGFCEIETPILEYYRTFDDDIYGFDAHRVWKTFDRQGSILALRPDSTIPAVRIAASRLKSEPLPLRLSYLQNIASFPSDADSFLNESTQAGVELMGESSPLADAEVIALAIDSLRSAGLKEFQIDLGQVDFFKGFMLEAGLTAEQTEIFRKYVEEKNMLAMQLFIRECEIPEKVSVRMMKLPQLYGDESVLKEAEAITGNNLCTGAIQNLRAILHALDGYGCRDYISIDLGMVHAVNYYSGMIFRGITGYLGRPLLSGGRYDQLPQRFGRAMPATGFGLSVNLLMSALKQQGEAMNAPVPDFVLGVSSENLNASLEWMAEKRREGLSIALRYDVTEPELIMMVRDGRAKAAVLFDRGKAKVFSGGAQAWK
jgi:ATP phosphoribosyltransferase regulatory subunit